MTKRAPLCALLALTPLIGCTDEPIDDNDTDNELAAACPVSGTNISRSLAVTTPAILAKFSFARTMNRLRATAGVATLQTNKAIFQAWFKTWGKTPNPGDCDDPNIDPNHYGLVCPRPAELKLSTIDPFAPGAQATFKPVALMNRFDLAPANGAHCGEYRIVYAMPNNSQILGRAFLIFEAALPNPNLAAGKVACLPVAQFWQDLTNDASDISRAAKLEKFYFTGGAVPGFPAVVDAKHYGLALDSGPFGAGQIRTNMFVDAAQWHLREFKTHKVCTVPTDPATCRLRLDHVTDKTNPAEELFAGSHAKSPAFRTSFVNSVARLASAGLNRIGMSINDQFNEFESISQAGNVIYDNVADTTIRGQIQTKLNQIGSTLTVKNVLDRATTQTCAGCHQVSPGTNLGGGLTWPFTLGFVHIDENSNLSPALTGTFLPFRKGVLESFINANCGPVAPAEPVDPELTVGGSVVGAAN